MAGRDAWQATLSARGQKPYPLKIATDAQSGLLLRYAAQGTPYFTEVTALTINEVLPDDTFSYNGPVVPYKPPVPARSEVEACEGVWAWLDSTRVDDGEFAECGVGDRVSDGGLRLSTAWLKPISGDEASAGFEQVHHSTRVPAYRIRGVVTQVHGPMALRISVAGLDVMARAATFRNVGTSDDESWQPYSDDFLGAAPGHWVEAEGEFEIPWSQEWDDLRPPLPQQEWTVEDLRVNRRKAKLGISPPTGVIDGVSDGHPRIKQWVDAKSFWIKLSPIDPVP